MAGVPMPVFIRRLLVCVAATTVAFGASSWQASALDEPRPSCTGLEPGPARTVTRVIDGETAALDDGTELRLIGARDEEERGQIREKLAGWRSILLAK